MYIYISIGNTPNTKQRFERILTIHVCVKTMFCCIFLDENRVADFSCCQDFLVYNCHAVTAVMG